MDNPKQLLSDYTEKLFQANHIDQQFITFTETIQAIGFDEVAYSYAPRLVLEQKNRPPPIFKVSPSYPLDFLAQYASQRLDESDYAIKAVLSGNLAPIDLWEQAGNGLLNASEQNVLNIGRYDYGIFNSLVVPTQADERGVAGAALVSRTKNIQHYTMLKQENTKLAIRITYQFHLFATHANGFKTEFLEPALSAFTPTQLRILQHLASGKHLKEMDGISYRFAQRTLNELLRSLHTENEFKSMTREQLLYLFGMLR